LLSARLSVGEEFVLGCVSLKIKICLPHAVLCRFVLVRCRGSFAD
jgi:hypothetical protein